MQFFVSALIALWVNIGVHETKDINPNRKSPFAVPPEVGQYGSALGYGSKPYLKNHKVRTLMQLVVIYNPSSGIPCKFAGFKHMYLHPSFGFGQ